MDDNNYCEVCGRWKVDFGNTKMDHLPCKERVEGEKVYYVHDGYGCDTGCCGHRVVIEDRNERVVKSTFSFDHDKEDLEYSVNEIAQRLNIVVGDCNFANCWMT